MGRNATPQMWSYRLANIVWVALPLCRCEVTAWPTSHGSPCCSEDVKLQPSQHCMGRPAALRMLSYSLANIVWVTMPLPQMWRHWANIVRVAMLLCGCEVTAWPTLHGPPCHFTDVKLQSGQHRISHPSTLQMWNYSMDNIPWIAMPLYGCEVTDWITSHGSPCRSVDVKFQIDFWTWRVGWELCNSHPIEMLFQCSMKKKVSKPISLKKREFFFFSELKATSCTGLMS